MRRALAPVLVGSTLVVVLFACGGGTDLAPPPDAAPDLVVVDTGIDVRDTSVPDVYEASVETGADAGAKEALYAGICVVTLSNRDPEQALRFYTQVKLAPSDAAMELRLTALKGWDANPPPSGKYVYPASVSKTETRGATVTANSVPFEHHDDDASTPKDRFTATFPTFNLVGEANSISGRDAVIENLELDGVLTLKNGGLPDRFCSTFGGQLTVPYQYTFPPNTNTCVFVKVTEGGALPTLAQNEYVCPF